MKTIFLCCALVVLVVAFLASQKEITYGRGDKHPSGSSYTQEGAPNASAQPEGVFPIDVSWLSPLFIDVRVNETPPMQFILDSASTYSMIRKKEAEALGLKTKSSTTLSGGGGEFRMDFANANLQVGNMKLSGVQLGVTDLSPAYTGILGDDLFESHVVTIDYETGKVSVFDPGTFRAPLHGIRVPVNIRGRIPGIEASLRYGGKTATGEFRIDTG